MKLNGVIEVKLNDLTMYAHRDELEFKISKILRDKISQIMWSKELRINIYSICEEITRKEIKEFNETL